MEDKITSPENTASSDTTIIINIKLPLETHTQLKTQAVAKRLTLKEYTLRLLEEAIAVKSQG